MHSQGRVRRRLLIITGRGKSHCERENWAIPEQDLLSVPPPPGDWRELDEHLHIDIPYTVDVFGVTYFNIPHSKANSFERSDVNMRN